MAYPYDPNYHPRIRVNHSSFNHFDPDVLGALREAYTFITQPNKAEISADPRIAPTMTYQVHDFNSLTEMLRRAIKNGEILEAAQKSS